MPKPKLGTVVGANQADRRSHASSRLGALLYCNMQGEILAAARYAHFFQLEIMSGRSLESILDGNPRYQKVGLFSSRSAASGQLDALCGGGAAGPRAAEPPSRFSTGRSPAPRLRAAPSCSGPSVAEVEGGRRALAPGLHPFSGAAPPLQAPDAIALFLPGGVSLELVLLCACLLYVQTCTPCACLAPCGALLPARRPHAANSAGQRTTCIHHQAGAHA